MPAMMKHGFAQAHILTWLGLLAFSGAIEMDGESDLIGWQGDSFDPQEVFPRQTEPYQISEHPRAYVWKNFISKQEAQHIVEIAAPRMKRSLVGGGQQVRTSYGMFIPRNQDQIIANVEQRIAKWLDLPEENQEDMQVLRYSPGQRYKQHMDANGRMCTLLVYLTGHIKALLLPVPHLSMDFNRVKLSDPSQMSSDQLHTTALPVVTEVHHTPSNLSAVVHVPDVPIGGETAFPSTTDENWLDPSYRPENLSNCALGHVAVKPEVGTALLFYSMPPGAEKDASLRKVDTMSMHTGCPPVEGKKWTLTKWVHFDAFRPETFSRAFKKAMPDPGLCFDSSPQCKRWAAAGECQNNEPYMIGTQGGEGHCRLSCNNCTHCPPNDAACLRAAREEQGYLGDLEGELRELFPNRH